MPKNRIFEKEMNTRKITTSITNQHWFLIGRIPTVVSFLPTRDTMKWWITYSAVIEKSNFNKEHFSNRVGTKQKLLFKSWDGSLFGFPLITGDWYYLHSWYNFNNSEFPECLLLLYVDNCEKIHFLRMLKCWAPCHFFSIRSRNCKSLKLLKELKRGLLDIICVDHL